MEQVEEQELAKKEQAMKKEQKQSKQSKQAGAGAGEGKNQMKVVRVLCANVFASLVPLGFGLLFNKPQQWSFCQLLAIVWWS